MYALRCCFCTTCCALWSVSGSGFPTVHIYRIPSSACSESKRAASSFASTSSAVATPPPSSVYVPPSSVYVPSSPSLSLSLSLCLSLSTRRCACCSLMLSTSSRCSKRVWKVSKSSTLSRFNGNRSDLLDSNL
ncbi:hypothetical protein B484DRAFT_441559 [Ochromonadaceae sp. CCMP2298]|nr:hypothetical protein B484DRAFT_441559 [Ochromonadaceae sp. CCMP2298]